MAPAETLPASKFTYLGLGWDTLGKQEKNLVLDFEISARSAVTECEIHTCTSSEEISNKLDINASLGYSNKGMEFDAKANFLSELSKQSTAITLLVKAKTSWDATIKNPRFADSVNAKAAIKDTSTLVNYAGDSYISSVTMGLEYYAAYQFTATSEEQRTKIEAEVKAKVSSVDASLNTNIENVKNESKAETTFKQILSGAALVLPEQTGVGKFALELSGKAGDNLMLLNFTTSLYSDLPSGVPSEFDKVSEWVKAYNEPKWYTRSVKEVEMAAMTNYNAIMSVINLYKFYGNDGIDKNLYANADCCYNAQNIIREWRGRYNGGKGRLEKPNMDIGGFQTPRPNFRVLEDWTWGRGGGGRPWKDIDENFVYSFGLPEDVEDLAGTVIDSLTCIYGFRNPLHPEDERQELNTVETPHGWNIEHKGSQSGTELSFPHTFRPNEIDTIVAWKCDTDDWRDIIAGVEIVRRGGTDRFVFGAKKGDWTGRTIPANSSFLGFNGRSADRIDAISPMYVKFEAPTWTSLGINNKNQ